MYSSEGFYTNRWHGRNLVGDTGDVSPQFCRRGYIICHVPPTFFSLGLYLERFQNQK